MQTGRNDPCPCGSGKKYKKCCGAAAASEIVAPTRQREQVVRVFQHGDFKTAVSLCLQSLRTSPRDAELLHLLGLGQLQLGQFTEAVKNLEKAARYAPRNPLVHSNLGRALNVSNEHDAAERHCQRALELDPALADAHHNLGNIFKNTSRHDRALHHYREAVRLSPAVVSYRCNLGTLLMERGEMEEAQRHFERAMEQEPSFPAAFANLGVLHLQRGRLEAARSALEEALKRQPDYAHALANLGLAQHLLGDLQEAVKSYRRAMELDPEIRHTYSSNLVTVLEDAGDHDAAHEAAVEVLEHAAERRMSLSAAIKNFGKTCDFARREQAERLWHRHVLEGRLPVDMLLGCNYTNGFSPEELLALHRRWAQPLEQSGQDSAFAPSVGTGRTGQRLRIGYLSPDFRAHATAYFVEPIVTNHDHDSFEIFCYHNHAREDAMTDRIRAHCNHFLNVSRFSDQQLRAQILDDGIDIIVDLAGHTEGSRLQMMARRAAPIQASYLGYPNTTGLQAMDYLIVDDYIAQTGMGYCTETPAILPECLVTFQPLPVAPGEVVPPCTQAGHITFGSLNNLMKITAEVISCWVRILAQVPESKLLIAYRGADSRCTRKHLEREFARHGIRAERLTLYGRRSREDFLALYRQIDLHLDTFTYTGTTTTCEALLMHVPVITKTGPAQRERVSASILAHLGMASLIADSESEYVENAVKLARDAGSLAALRRALPGRLSGSVLCRPERHARALEGLYRGMWQRYRHQDTRRAPLMIENRA